MLRELPGYTLGSLYRDVNDYPQEMGEQFADVQARLIVEAEETGQAKVKVEDAGTKKGKNWARARTQESKMRMAQADNALRAKGIMS